MWVSGAVTPGMPPDGGSSEDESSSEVLNPVMGAALRETGACEERPRARIPRVATPTDRRHKVVSPAQVSMGTLAKQEQYDDKVCLGATQSRTCNANQQHYS